MAENDLVLSFYDVLLRKSDLDLLTGPNWLNDQIISFYYEYLSRCLFRKRRNILFICPEVTQCMKIINVEEIGTFLEPLEAKSKDLIFFALNDNQWTGAGGTHWSLLVFSRPELTFYHFDSSTPSNQAVSRLLFEKLKVGLECPDAVLKEGRCLQQTNGYDCGIHLICETEHIANHFKRSEKLDNVYKLPKKVVEIKREHILSMIDSLCKGETKLFEE